MVRDHQNKGYRDGRVLVPRRTQSSRSLTSTHTFGSTQTADNSRGKESLDRKGYRDGRILVPKRSQSSRSLLSTHTVGSTQTADNLRGKVILDRKQRNTVSFDITKNVEYCNHIYSEEDICKLGLWYERKDFKSFKANTLENLRFIRFRPQHHYATSLLQIVYDKCTHAPKDVTDDQILESQAILELRNVNSNMTNARIGMDQWILSELNEDRLDRRSTIVDSVLDIQEVVKTMTVHGNVSEFIRVTCENISRPARRFARCTASIIDPTMQLNEQITI